MLILYNTLVIKIYINIFFSISDFSLFSSYHFFILHFFTIRLILDLYCLLFIPFFINYMIRNIILYKNKLILIFKKQVKNLIILNKNYFIKSSKFCLKTLNC